MWAYRAKGNDAAVERVAKGLAEITLFADVAHCELATLAYDRGDAAEAERHYLKSLAPEDRDRPFVAVVVRALHAVEARPEAMRVIGAHAGGVNSSLFCARMILRVYDWMFIGPDQVGKRIMQRLWAPRHKALWSNPEFKKMLIETGVVAYWRRHGWPDRCRPKGDDFICD